MKSLLEYSIIRNYLVAPLAGAWIEMLEKVKHTLGDTVAPLAGAWIEINEQGNTNWKIDVAPLAGAWIEILLISAVATVRPASLPSRERGLK